MRVSVGICAYNEEKNIGKLLNALLNQNVNKIRIDEIIVVSSGSTDRTNDIVKEYSKVDKRVVLITQSRREGKASAVNEFLKNASNKICVLESADTFPLEDTIERLCLPFLNKKVGMAGGHPIPINDSTTFMGFVGHLLWDLHHKISLETPKLGELVAFRNVIDGIPKDTAVDEAWIEAKMRMMGYEVVYVPDAICYNKAPETIGDYLRQRRRIHAGHIHLKKTLGYAVSTMNTKKIIKYVIKDTKPNPKTIGYTLGAMLLEAVGKLLGLYDYYVRKKNHAVWETVESTKELMKNEIENEVNT